MTNTVPCPTTTFILSPPHTKLGSLSEALMGQRPTQTSIILPQWLTSYLFEAHKQDMISLALSACGCATVTSYFAVRQSLIVQCLWIYALFQPALIKYIPEPFAA